MRKWLSLLMALLLIPMAAAESGESPVATGTSLPMAENNRQYAYFSRADITSAETAIEQAKEWLNLPLLCTNFPSNSASADWTAMQADEGWYVTGYMRGTFVWMLLDESGYLIDYRFHVLAEDGFTYDGSLPENIDDAIQSYIARFAELNGLGALESYERGDATSLGNTAVSVKATAVLGGKTYRFTMRLDMLAFTEIESLDADIHAAQTQRDVLLLMRDDLLEKGINTANVFFAVQVLSDGTITGIASFPGSEVTDVIKDLYGEQERYTLLYHCSASAMGIDSITLSEQEDEVLPEVTNTALQTAVTVYTLVEGRYLVQTDELPAGTAYAELETINAPDNNILPLEWDDSITRIVYSLTDDEVRFGWVSTNALYGRSAKSTVPTLSCYGIVLNGETYTLFATDMAEDSGYDTYADTDEADWTVEQALTVAALAVMEKYGVDASSLTSCVAEYGYMTGRGNCRWQVNFRITNSNGSEAFYEVLLKDTTGEILGVWNSEASNG